MKTIFTLLSILIVFGATILAQSNASANATVKAQLKKGLSISNLSGDLDFGEIILNGSSQTPAVDPSDGVTFEVIGHPNKDITVAFSSVTLNNDAWVTANGGTNGTLGFTPSVEHTGSSNSYSSGTTVTSGNTYSLVNETGDGYLYLWLGGSLSVGASQAHGDYTGTFSMTVAY